WLASNNRFVLPIITETGVGKAHSFSSISELKQATKSSLKDSYIKMLEYNRSVVEKAKNQNDALDALNDIQRVFWEMAQETTLALNQGDMVCDFDNNMGYVEKLNQTKAKVLWTALVVGEPKGFWFGSRGYHTIVRNSVDQFEYKAQKQNRYAWSDKKQIASCTF
ncbi:hypothetical protein AB4238_09825, partial [Shewanella sp. 10N.286.45.A1]|uniref:hypothetical protein n=1 Tax=Shewanella sp. 10N.286.45.A1 TaxID=3229694 RepID=UPI00354BD7ED